MKNILLSVIFLIVFMGCQTIEKTVIYQPVLPPVPTLIDPGRPVADGDETDELEIIIKQAHTIEDLMLWIYSVEGQINRMGDR